MTESTTGTSSTLPSLTNPRDLSSVASFVVIEGDSSLEIFEGGEWRSGRKLDETETLLSGGRWIAQSDEGGSTYLIRSIFEQSDGCDVATADILSSDYTAAGTLVVYERPDATVAGWNCELQASADPAYVRLGVVEGREAVQRSVNGVPIVFLADEEGNVKLKSERGVDLTGTDSAAGPIVTDTARDLIFYVSTSDSPAVFVGQTLVARQMSSGEETARRRFDEFIEIAGYTGDILVMNSFSLGPDLKPVQSSVVILDRASMSVSSIASDERILAIDDLGRNSS